MEPLAQFSENLRRLRLANGMTQEALSDASELDPGEISRLERGDRNPRLLTIVRLARGLDVTLPELLSGVE
ncbi:helix-turn-helix domain-containing protein [Solirubrobacter soli]|uniref:helix-turn-helix domain-containing protein n=1 Tax=Solirubrobacter soli TaxID=363832 RepID=UPI0004051F0F|nr:helix-turn-helix transcriptional regulator [Solirubrobacter soli]